MPVISVLMPVYNGKKYLHEAIQSVLGQSFQNFEFLIIDDGSNDESAEIIKNYPDSRIRYIWKEHSGLIDTLNLGLKESSGQFIARFDCDDICESERLETQLAFLLEHPEIVLAGSHAVSIDADGNSIGALNYTPEHWSGIKRYAHLHNPFIHPTVMFKKEIIEEVGVYNAHYKHAEDYELWTRIVYKHPCANIVKPLLRYRVHPKQVTRESNFEMRWNGTKARFMSIARSIF